MIDFVNSVNPVINYFNRGFNAHFLFVMLQV